MGMLQIDILTDEPIEWFTWSISSRRSFQLEALAAAIPSHPVACRRSAGSAGVGG